MFWNIKEWTPGINQRVSGQCRSCFSSELIRECDLNTFHGLWASKQAAGPRGKQLDPLHISVASTVRLCHSAVSLSKALATVMVPLWGSILKALAPLLLLSIEYLRTEQKHDDSNDETFNSGSLFCCQEANIVIKKYWEKNKGERH